jgi:hypothetical protein
MDARASPATPEAFVDELESRVRTHVLAAMPADPSGELAGKRLGDLLMVYGNWRSRFVWQRPRAVHLSAQLKRLIDTGKQHNAALADIVQSIENGAALTKYLSRGTKTAYVPVVDRRGANLAQRRDLDLLIADWRIHHLHLGLSVESDGFVARTDDLLFVHFAEADAYLVGIYPHGSWALRELLEVIVREFAGAGLLAKLGGLSLTAQPTEQEHLQLRKSGVLQPVEVDGALYFALGGITTAGTPADVTIRVDRIMLLLRDMRSSLGTVLDALDAKYGNASDPWEPYVEDDTLGLRRGDGRIPLADLW